MRCTTFQQLLDAVDEVEKATDSRSYKHFFRLVANQLEVHFGQMKIEEITPYTIVRYKAKKMRDDGCKGSTANRHLAVLKKVFNCGIGWGLIPGPNPVCSDSVKYEKESKGREFFLSPAKQAQLLEACPPQLRIPVLLALRLGMRKGDLLALTAGDLDLAADRLRVLDRKTQEWRWLPIPDAERPILKALAERARAEQTLGANPEGWLFVTKFGRRYSEGGFRNEFRKVLKRLDLNQFHWHDLRHCCASDLVNSGASLPVVGKVLGHKDPRTTNRYAHLEVEPQRKAFTERAKWLTEREKLPA